MTVNDVYERVAEVTTPDRKTFFIFLNDCIADLEAAYGAGAVYFPGKRPKDVTLRQGDVKLNINELYHVALADYICYRMGAGDVYLQEYARKAEAAYHTLYHKRWRKVKRVIRKDVW